MKLSELEALAEKATKGDWWCGELNTPSVNVWRVCRERITQ